MKRTKQTKKARRSCIRLIRDWMREQCPGEAVTDRDAKDYAIHCLAKTIAGGGIIADAEATQRFATEHAARLVQEMTGRETAILADGTVIFADEADELERPADIAPGPLLH